MDILLAIFLVFIISVLVVVYVLMLLTSIRDYKRHNKDTEELRALHQEAKSLEKAFIELLLQRNKMQSEENLELAKIMSKERESVQKVLTTTVESLMNVNLERSQEENNMHVKQLKKFKEDVKPITEKVVKAKRGRPAKVKVGNGGEGGA